MERRLAKWKATWAATQKARWERERAQRVPRARSGLRDALDQAVDTLNHYLEAADRGARFRTRHELSDALDVVVFAIDAYLEAIESRYRIGYELRRAVALAVNHVIDVREKEHAKAARNQPSGSRRVARSARRRPQRHRRSEHE